MTFWSLFSEQSHFFKKIEIYILSLNANYIKLKANISFFSVSNIYEFVILINFFSEVEKKANHNISIKKDLSTSVIFSFNRCE